MNIRQLYEALSYQVNTPAVTTMGLCDTPDCEHSARGSLTCKHCLSTVVDGILDNRMASKWAIQQGEANRTRWMLEAAVEEVARASR